MSTRRSPPLNALRAFEAAARWLNFARAADELHVTAAAVSQRIRDLESWLDVRLFERKARGVALTEAGQRYRDQIADAFARIERATAELGSAPVDGPLRVSMPQSLAQHWFLPRLGALRQRHPGLMIHIEADSRPADLRRGLVDVGLRFGTGEWVGLDCELLMRDAVTVLASPALIGKREEGERVRLISEHPLIEDEGVSAGQPWGRWGPWLREVGLDAVTERATLHFSNGALCVQACELGLGLCVGRLSVVHECVLSNRLRPLLPWRSTEFAYHCVTRPADRDAPRIQAFRAWLKDEVGDYRARVRSLFELGA